jgi:hypothetical protein
VIGGDRWLSMVMMKRPLGVHESDAGQQRHLTILARCGTAKPPNLSYFPYEMIRLRNRADM